jgi:hypothetical protein
MGPGISYSEVQSAIGTGNNAVYAMVVIMSPESSEEDFFPVRPIISVIINVNEDAWGTRYKNTVP